MTRFDGQDLVDAWAATGLFPAIHGPVFNLLRQELSPDDAGAVLDLGCSTGLLTRRLHDAGYSVFGVDASQDAAARGAAAGAVTLDAHDGTPLPVVLVQRLAGISGAEALGNMLATLSVRTVVARRVLPELDDAGISPSLLGTVLRNTGVQHLVLEGRLPSRAATHRLRSVDHEVAQLAQHWQVGTLMGQTAYLTRRTPTP